MGTIQRREVDAVRWHDGHGVAVVVELSYSERCALLTLLQSYMADAARDQVFEDFSVVPPAKVSSEQLLHKIAKAVAGRKRKKNGGRQNLPKALSLRETAQHQTRALRTQCQTTPKQSRLGKHEPKSLSATSSTFSSPPPERAIR